MPDEHYAPLSPCGTGFRCRCPGCGQGRLFGGVLTAAPRRDVCGLDCGSVDPGVRPAVFAVLVVGFVVVGAMLAAEAADRLHALLRAPLILALSLGLARPVEGLMISLQHRKAAEGRSADR